MKDEIKYGFGPHLMLDLYGCPSEKLTDVNFIFNALDALPAKIGMTKIMPPYVFRYEGKVKDHAGVSGIVLIAESHITIHTFPEQGHAFIDIFSCKEFDTAFAAAHIIKLFEAANHKLHLNNRGQEFPKRIKTAADIITKERRTLSERPRAIN